VVFLFERGSMELNEGGVDEFVVNVDLGSNLGEISGE